MSAPLPSALWTWFQRYIEEGLSGRAAALRLKLSAATGAPWAGRSGPRGMPGHCPSDVPKVMASLHRTGAFSRSYPDITLIELRDALAAAEGVRVHHSSIASLLPRLGFTCKISRWWPPNAAVPG